MPIVRINEPITAWQDGDFAQGFALIVRREVRQDRKGRDYVDLELADSSGSIPAKIWPDSPALKSHPGEKSFVAFKGTVRLFREQLQLNLDHCRPVNDGDREKGFDEASLIPTAPQGIDSLWSRFEAIYPARIGRPELRRLTEVLLQRHGEAFKEHPAAKSIHHAYRGGLLEHVVHMAELSLDACRLYTELDRDLLLLGVLLHDLGKLRELGSMPSNDYTVEGQLIGHIVLGQQMLRDACDALGADSQIEVPEHLRLHLEHLILSHHGRREYGSPIEPATAEALVLHSIDSLDSKLSQLRSIRRSGVQGMHFHRPMGRNLFFDPELDADKPATGD